MTPNPSFNRSRLRRSAQSNVEDHACLRLVLSLLRPPINFGVRRSMTKALYLALLLLCATSRTVAADQDVVSAPSSTWCPPDGPRITRQLTTDNMGMLKPSWVTVQMRVRPGAVPVSDVRVASEAGGEALAREWLALVRQWTGCASNERDTVYRVKFTLGIRGNYQLPAKEGFAPRAFLKPRGAPALPTGDYGVGICPIRATLQLRQPESVNVVVDLESQGSAAVSNWLERLVPDREYMVPAAKGNRIEFDCKVSNGVVSFYDN